ncbi:serine/threonine protein kinase [Microbacterium paludicola]|uniref:non-specific serine/threonine protein kinase n=1 Tax=Microbacterium paludicola TaxID=300019 RepID=A0A4Y9FVC3_9MICO|nr:serine/threonine-protein kinase [Microbacterium paludicola]MBF0816102.1 serine/threonine protein kinase [Microbacterium paludicola]TFU33283.1 serine/threonine protein kinase [Microbacterium paludicola]
MNQRRPPAPPPQLPGFTHLELLGSGGFADVYLYEQELPRRRVAVKVLLPDRISTSATQFTAEANVMAMLSTHPAIVTIYQAGVSSDGRPYLVMEYCPRPNLQVRYRREPFSAAEALRVGIQVAAAVETAHRAGVLHRDIKPANILVTEYNRPALTDFGIASTSQSGAETTGMSIPWSPPEVFATGASGALSGPRTDVYQLGATIYTLLAGRSPFELPGQRNGSAELIERIERMPLPAIDRPDVPSSLYAVLARAMAKDPDARYPSAVALARALQKVQIELAHSVTPIDILDEHPLDAPPEDDDGGLTRVRGITSIAQLDTAKVERAPIDPATRPSARTAEVAPAPAVDDDATVARGPRVVEPVDDATVWRPRAAPAPAGPEGVAAEEPAPRSRRWPTVVAVSVLGVAAVGIAAATLPGLLAPQPEPSPTRDTIVQDPTGGDAVPLVTDGRGVIQDANAVFSWNNPDPEAGDYYRWHRNSLAGPEPAQVTEERTVTVPLEGATQVCIDVYLHRADDSFTDEPATICTG